MLKLWFTIGLILAGILVFRGIANQPCTAAIGCIVPYLYLGIKPLLTLGAMALLGQA